MDDPIKKIILTAEKIDFLQKEIQLLKEDMVQYVWDKKRERFPDLIDKPKEEILNNQIKDEDKDLFEKYPKFTYTIYMAMEADERYSEAEKESFKAERKKIIQSLFDSLKMRLLKLNPNLK